MNNDIKKLIETIKTEANTKHLTAFVFIGYFLLHTAKGSFVKDGIKEQDMYKYLILNKASKKQVRSNKLTDFSMLLEIIDHHLSKWKETDEKAYSKIIENWNILGLKTLRQEYKKNKSGMNKIFLKIIYSKITIENLMDLFEGLKVTNKKFQDHFTPTDLSTFASEIMMEEANRFVKQESIKLYDPTCGIGRLFYPAFVSLKEKYPNKTIEILGMDLCEEYAVFTQSLFSLINLNHTHIFIGNSLYADPFSGTKMDIGLSNPPFGIKDYGIDTKLELLKFEDTLTSSTREHLSLSLEKKYNKVPLISKKEYLSIKNDFRAA